MSDLAMEHEVIRRWQEQTPMRRIAAELRISRHRVKRIIVDHQAGRTQGITHPDLPTPPESRGSILDGQVPFIQDLLGRWPAITALRILGLTYTGVTLPAKCGNRPALTSDDFPQPEGPKITRGRWRAMSVGSV